jgi:hypothetical protein
MMHIQVSHSYGHFVTANYAQYAINEFIQSQNVQYGYVIGFSIKNIKKSNYTFGNRMLENVKQHLGDQINAFFASYQDKLLFMSENGSFFVLLKTDSNVTRSLKLMYEGNYQERRKTNDPLVEFEKFVFKPYSFHGIDINPNINLMAGLYGVHDNDIFNLIYDLQTMIE